MEFSYPWTCNNIGDGRAYSADEITKYMQCLTTFDSSKQGVVYNCDSDNFAVLSTDTNRITIGTGCAFVDGTYYESDSPIVIDLEEGSGTIYLKKDENLQTVRMENIQGPFVSVPDPVVLVNYNVDINGVVSVINNYSPTGSSPIVHPYTFTSRLAATFFGAGDVNSIDFDTVSWAGQGFFAYSGVGNEAYFQVPFSAYYRLGMCVTTSASSQIVGYLFDPNSLSQGDLYVVGQTFNTSGLGFGGNSVSQYSCPRYLQEGAQYTVRLSALTGNPDLVIAEFFLELAWMTCDEPPVLPNNGAMISP